MNLTNQHPGVDFARQAQRATFNSQGSPRTSWITRTLFLLIAALLLASVHAAKLPLAHHPDLRESRLLYQRTDGIYLRTPGEQSARKLIRNGTYPRWVPGGDAFVFIRDDQILLYEFENKRERILAQASSPRAVAFHPNGEAVWFIDGKNLCSAPRTGGGPVRIEERTADFRELNFAPDGTFLAVTVKRLTGFRVERLDPFTGRKNEIGRGCSANVSPDGRTITVNLGSHRELALHDSATGRETSRLFAPPGLQLDNQHWSNHPDWIVAVAEGDSTYVIAQRVSDGKAYRLTPESDCNRPALFFPVLANRGSSHP